jgi:ATP-dependent RNA helicase DDX47/RRP3
MEATEISENESESAIKNEPKGEQIEDTTAPSGEYAFKFDEKDDGITFESMGLVPQLCEACKSMGFKKPSKIQKESLPWALKGKYCILS